MYLRVSFKKAIAYTTIWKILIIDGQSAKELPSYSMYYFVLVYHLESFINTKWVFATDACLTRFLCCLMKYSLLLLWC